MLLLLPRQGGWVIKVAIKTAKPWTLSCWVRNVVEVPNGAEAVFAETTAQRKAKFIQGWIVEVRIHEKIACENTTVNMFVQKLH